MGVLKDIEIQSEEFYDSQMQEDDFIYEQEIEEAFERFILEFPEEFDFYLKSNDLNFDEVTFEDKEEFVAYINNIYYFDDEEDVSEEELE
ncbi:MAG: hypothetical protein EOL97_09430 [Spirochaetia bacterium]|nr:hypothetical protein [Spirochaetia bacterium]